MNIKNILFLFLFVPLFSCHFSNGKKATEIIAKFQFEKAIDKRETIFNVVASYKNGRWILEGETDNSTLKSELFLLLNQFDITDKVNILPDSTVGKNTYGIVNLSVANLRTAPQHSAELATQALLGTPVKLLKKDNDWFLIQTPDKYIAWIDSEGIVPISEKQLTDWKQSQKIIFTGDNGNIYKTDKFKIPVSDIAMGNILNVEEENYKAIKIRFPDGRQGFTTPDNWKDFDEFKNNIQPDTIHLKHLANQLMGRPYLWGGTSARAMDCSGFVKTIYFMNGLLLARDASLQTKHGDLVNTESNFNEIMTGDLLFFGQKKTQEQSEKVTHVALSFGKTEFIHAAGKIKRNSFNPKSKIYSVNRTNNFIRARRVMNVANQNGIQQLKNHPWY
ncbi:MAG: C40 family peptidase [Bacteroidetes bacterium]|nr:C40 family peptidase [Bacteroidota bacterium]